MKFKLNTLVAAVVLSATAMSANAAIDANSGNSEIFFSAWDADAGVGYTYDLNWDKFLNDLVGIDQATSVTGNATLLANAKVSSSLIGANGIIFDDVLTGLPFAGASLANAQWNISGFDIAGRSRLLITQEVNGVPFTPNNNQPKSAGALLSTYSVTSNGLITDASLTDSFAVTSLADGAAYAGIYGSGYNNNLSKTTNAFGATADLFFIAQTTQSNVSTPSFVQQLTSVGGESIVAKTYLQDGAWRLQISAVTVAAVPEPETYAMLLAGLGFVGAIARRRNKQA